MVATHLKKEVRKVWKNNKDELEEYIATNSVNWQQPSYVMGYRNSMFELGILVQKRCHLFLAIAHLNVLWQSGKLS